MERVEQSRQPARADLCRNASDWKQARGDDNRNGAEGDRQTGPACQGPAGPQVSGSEQQKMDRASQSARAKGGNAERDERWMRRREEDRQREGVNESDPERMRRSRGVRSRWRRKMFRSRPVDNWTDTLTKFQKAHPATDKELGIERDSDGEYVRRRQSGVSEGRVLGRDGMG